MSLERPSPENTDASDQKCDYCRLPIPGDPVTAEFEDDTYHFCSEPCQEMITDEEGVFAEYHGFRQFDTGVSTLQSGLPQGMPRNSFVLISGEPGTRDEELHGELVWRALERGEPALIVPFLDTPVSAVQGFIELGWNVLPYLHSGQLRILDCFTYRLDNAEEIINGMSDWNRHLHDVAMESTETVRDPTNPQAILNGLERCLDEMTDEAGLVVIDSLTEFGSLVQPVQAYDFVKDLRASVCKTRTVPVFASASRAGDDFPHDLGYIADGIIDIVLAEGVIEDTLMRRIRVRKMNGVHSIRRWETYEFAKGHGLVATKPSDDEADDESSTIEVKPVPESSAAGGGPAANPE